MSRQVLPTAPSPTITHWGRKDNRNSNIKIALKNGVITQEYLCRVDLYFFSFHLTDELSFQQLELGILYFKT